MLLQLFRWSEVLYCFFIDQQGDEGNTFYIAQDTSLTEVLRSIVCVCVLTDDMVVKFKSTNTSESNR